MDIKTLTSLMHEFVASKGWYQPDSKRSQSGPAISLNLEAAEVLEQFQWTDECENHEDLAGELADVALYLLQIASVSGIDLEKAILDKLSINANRTMGHRKMKVSIFGGASPKTGSPAYQQAYDLGKKLAISGHTVITGGYSGTMEAISRGAQKQMVMSLV